MEIIGEEAHRLLAYVEAVARQGHTLTSSEFAAYANGWDQKVTYTGGSALSLTIAELQRSVAASLYGDRVKDVESFLDYLCRLMWLEKTDDRVEITPLGKAVLREANAPRGDSDTESTLEVVIDPENPFAYAQLMAKLTSLEKCLIVDPYLDVDQLIVLAGFPNVTRILTGGKGLSSKEPAFALVLSGVPHLEVRTVPQRDLHDRFAIPASGSVYMLGSSLNSIAKRFGVATTLEERTSRLIAENYQSMWERATQIAPQQPANVQGRLTLTGTADFSSPDANPEPDQGKGAT